MQMQTKMPSLCTPHDRCISQQETRIIETQEVCVIEGVRNWCDFKESRVEMPKAGNLGQKASSLLYHFTCHRVS